MTARSGALPREASQFWPWLSGLTCFTWLLLRLLDRHGTLRADWVKPELLSSALLHALVHDRVLSLASLIVMLLWLGPGLEQKLGRSLFITLAVGGSCAAARAFDLAHPEHGALAGGFGIVGALAGVHTVDNVQSSPRMLAPWVKLFAWVVAMAVCIADSTTRTALLFAVLGAFAFGAIALLWLRLLLWPVRDAEFSVTAQASAPDTPARGLRAEASAASEAAAVVTSYRALRTRAPEYELSVASLLILGEAALAVRDYAVVLETCRRVLQQTSELASIRSALRVAIAAQEAAGHLNLARSTRAALNALSETAAEVEA